MVALRKSSSASDELPAMEMAPELLDDDAVMQMTPPKWLIEDTLPAHSMAMLYAKQDSYKSFLAYDWARSIAAGQDKWQGYPIPKEQRGNVVYIAAEGAHGYRARLFAWNKNRKRTAAAQKVNGFYLWRDAVYLKNPDSVDYFIRSIEPLEPVLVVVDTMSRCMSDADENTEGHVAINFADKLRREFGCTTLFVHHIGYAQAQHPRGDSRVPAACDMIAKLEAGTGKTPTATLRFEKMKEGGKDGGNGRDALKLILKEYRGEDGIHSLAIASAKVDAHAKGRRTTAKGTARVRREDVIDYLVEHYHTHTYVTAEGIEDETGWKRKNVTDHLLRLKADGDVLTNNKGGYRLTPEAYDKAASVCAS